MARFNRGRPSPLSSFLKDNFILIILITGVAYLYFTGGLSKLFNSVTKMADDTVNRVGSWVGAIQSKGDVAAAEAAGNAGSCWSPSYYHNSPTGSHLITNSYAKQLAKQIYDSWGFFAKDYASTLSAFKQLDYKTQVSFLAEVFSNEYKKDLVAFLRPASWTFDFRNYPTDEEFENISNYVNSLK